MFRSSFSQVYVFGGFTATNPPVALASLEMYDPISNTWTTKAPMHIARGNPAKAVVGGFLLAIGGEVKNVYGNLSVPIGSIEFYDPTLDAWSADTATLALPRFRFSVGQSANKYVSCAN